MALLTGAALLGGGYLFGKSAGGGMEILTSKKEEMTIIAPFSPFTYAPVITTETTTITGSPYATTTSKKEIAGATTPMTQLLTPTQAQGTAGGGGGGIDFMSILIIGGFGLGAYYLIKKK